MSFTFREATQGGSNWIIGLSGASGSGKTLSALKLAKGIAGDRPFALIDTENGRASHYAGREFRFDVGELHAPFSPAAYADAIKAADEAHYPVVVVDSFSHSWAGEGGVLDMQEAELDRMAGTDWKKRESCKMAAWIKPKMAMKSTIQRLLQVRAHVILCLRAEAKIEMVRGDNGRMEARAKQSLTGLDGWIPVCAKELPYELTASFLLTADAPGMPKPIKLQDHHRSFFPLDRPISEEAGRKIAEWAAGGIAKKPAPESNPLMETSEREAILARIKTAGTILNLSALARKATWSTHCGATTPATATMTQLSALCDALEAEAMQTGAPSAEEIFR